MELQITIPDEQAERLKRRAKAGGFATVEEYVKRTIADRTGVSARVTDADPSVDWHTPVELLTSDQWQARFADIVRRQESRNPDFDDSRDSIYD